MSEKKRGTQREKFQSLHRSSIRTFDQLPAASIVLAETFGNLINLAPLISELYLAVTELHYQEIPLIII